MDVREKQSSKKRLIDAKKTAFLKRSLYWLLFDRRDDDDNFYCARGERKEGAD